MAQRIACMMFGFGSVARELVRLAEEKAALIRERYGREIAFTVIVTGRHGRAWNPEGLPAGAALEAYRAGDLSVLSVRTPPEDPLRIIEEIPADLFIELTPLDPEEGRPALDYIRAALDAGMDVVTANKGPIAHAYHELRDQAAHRGRRLRFESTVMDGIPVFKLGACGLPGAEIRALRGILNSTTHLVLTEMERGRTMAAAVRKAQDLGIAETDPSHDLEGWDAAVKICILARVLMNARLRPQDVQRRGITGLTPGDLQAAVAESRRIKLVCRAARNHDGTVRASVGPEPLPEDDLLARLSGTATGLVIETDVLTPLGLFELADSSPRQTAYGVLADILHLITHPSG